MLKELFTMWQSIVDYLIYDLMKLDKTGHLAPTLHFFIYDSVKILFLLAIIIFIISVIRTYITPEKTKKILGGRKLFIGNIIAAVIGIFTPFCSCSAIPLFIGFVVAGVPLGVTFTFLVSSPMINEIAVALLLATFGWKITLIYIITGMIIAIISGIIIDSLKLEKYVEEFVYNTKVGKVSLEDNYTFRDRMRYGCEYVRDIISKVWVYVLIGVGIGAFMHGYIPSNALAKWIGTGNPFSVIIAVAVGVPLYSNAAGIIPIVKELTRLGVQVGTALAFMMATTALSLPEFIILKKVLKMKLLLSYFSIVAIGIIFVGYLFNILI